MSHMKIFALGRPTPSVFMALVGATSRFSIQKLYSGTINLANHSGTNLYGSHCSKCEPMHDPFYVDNTRQVRGLLPGHAKPGVVGQVIEQISRSSGSYSI